MATTPIDTGPATLFNAHMTDLGNRIGTFCNFLLLVDGGILSITIGAFVSAAPPALPMDGLWAIRSGWYFLTAGLVFALAITYLVLAGQMHVQWKMRESFTPQPTTLQLHKGPEWLGYVIRIAIATAFLCSVIGIVCVSYGAVQMLRLPVVAAK